MHLGNTLYFYQIINKNLPDGEHWFSNLKTKRESLQVLPSSLYIRDPVSLWCVKTPQFGALSQSKHKTKNVKLNTWFHCTKGHQPKWLYFWHVLVEWKKHHWNKILPQKCLFLISKCVGKTYLAAGSFYERQHCGSSTLVPVKLSKVGKGKDGGRITWNLSVMMES